jgi:hypothetical protein
MRSLKKEAADMTYALMGLLFNSVHYGERRGAAYGLAAIVKGVGMSLLRELDIINSLKEALASKKSANQREGALLCIQVRACLSVRG